MAENSKTYSAKQVASRIGTDAKQLRKFFRDPNSGYTSVGQGGRYDFPEADIPKIKIAFDVWNSTKTRRNRTPSPQAKPLATPTVPLIPGQRKDSPTPTPRRSKDNKEGLHHNALDDDTLQERFAGIAARVQRHGLTVKQGRFVSQEPTKNTTSGLTVMPESQLLDFTEEGDHDPTDAELEELFAQESGTTEAVSTAGDDVLELDELSDEELEEE